MKIRKWLLATSSALLLPNLVVLPITSCSKDSESKLPTVNSHRVVNALLNKLVRPVGGAPYYVTSKYGDVEVHHFNDGPVGYINVDDYVNTLMLFEDLYGKANGNFKSKTSNEKTVITNLANNSTCTIDYKEQKLIFSDYDMFLCSEKEYASNPLAVGAGGGEDYFIKSSNPASILWDSKYVSGGEYTIDLNKYGITAYYYEGKGYLPYDVYRNILNSNPLTYMFYNGVGFYEVDTANSNTTINLYEKIKNEATIVNQEYMNYCYNLLALTLDNRFGLYERPSRANPGQTVKYFKDGAYKALEPYKLGLTSLSPDISNDYMCQFFADEVDDGGHAGYSGLNYLATKPHERTWGPERQNTQDAAEKVAAARTAYYEATGDAIDPSDYWIEKPEPVPSIFDNYIKLYETDGKAPILYITFDAFNAIETYNTSSEELSKQKVIYGKQTENNYTLDTIRMTMYADKFIKDYNDKSEHSANPIKNIVLDISNNGGGTVYTEHFIASWLCGGVQEKIWNPHTKSYAEYTIKADVNGDGTFSADDYLGSNMNVYCITSEMSFSCGNMLPCNLVDAANGCKSESQTQLRTTDNTKFIGCPSGGGACFVDGNMHVGLGNVFRSSINYHMLKGSSTVDEKVSVESGCQPTEWFIPVKCTWEKCIGYVDRETINKKIRGEV